MSSRLEPSRPQRGIWFFGHTPTKSTGRNCQLVCGKQNRTKQKKITGLAQLWAVGDREVWRHLWQMTL